MNSDSSSPHLISKRPSSPKDKIIDLRPHLEAAKPKWTVPKPIVGSHVIIGSGGGPKAILTGEIIKLGTHPAPKK